MPIILKTALEQQIERWQKYGSPLPNSYEKTNQCVCYNGETITSSVNGSNPQNGDPSPTLSTRCNRMYCVEKLDTVCYDARGNGDGKICPTVTGDHNNRITDYTTIICEQYCNTDIKSNKKVYYCLQGNGINRTDTAGCNGCGWRENECYTLNTIDIPAVCYEENKIYIVRRLTPLECGRLQGMPDWYVSDVLHSDANEYKLWGNGMALPNALYIMEGFI